MRTREGQRPPYRVLVFPGGTEVGLEVQRSLAHLKEVILFGAGSQADTHGPFAFRTYSRVPDVSQPDWMGTLNEVIDRFHIDLVYPGHDEVLMALVQHRREIHAAVVAPPLETCVVIRSKRQTYESLAGAVPTPRVFTSVDEIKSFPVFVKPDRSQGSHGARLAHDADDVQRALTAGSDLIMEFLPGPEYTVDCFSDREAGLLFVRGRRRIRIRAGISMASQPEGNQPAFLSMAEAIAGRLELHGAWFFQVREGESGRLTLLEIGARIAGTMAVHRVLGVNFPLLTLYEHTRERVTIETNDIAIVLDRALTNRYQHNLEYSAVYVDLDDTLVVRGEINARLAPFLFQCVNQGHRLVLITRHASDVETTLGRYRVAGLWDEIIQVKDGTDKADHIREPDAILIDDSFRERHTAHRRLGIATFDSSMIEMLIDDRA